MANASSDATSLPSPLIAAHLETPAAESTPGHAVRRLRVALGTWIALEATAASESAALTAIEGAYAAVAEIAWRLHPLREGSDLARINTAPPGTRVPIHATSARVLRLALQIYALTDGVFDPCLPILPGRFGNLELSGCSAGSPWALCHSPLALDLGGIAKGYAVDCAIEALLTAGCAAGFVNAGGDLRLFGAQRETILLRHTEGACEPLSLENTALAVSDADSRRRPAEHRGYYLRRIAGGAARRFAAVLAPTAAVADALTKCVLLDPGASTVRALQALSGREAA
jgi:FAD:protein FMN transferase